MKNKRLDMKQLLGFSGMEGAIDMAAPGVATRLGAKVGEPVIPKEPGEESLNLSALLGFDSKSTEIDFRDPAMASQLGAKIGEP